MDAKNLKSSKHQNTISTDIESINDSNGCLTYQNVNNIFICIHMRKFAYNFKAQSWHIKLEQL